MVLFGLWVQNKIFVLVFKLLPSMKNIFSLFTLFTVLFFLIPNSSNSKIRLPHIFGDHMVLQRQQPIPLWGWADPFEKVNVVFKGRNYPTQAGKDGKWQVKMEPSNAGVGYVITVKGKKDKLILNNVKIGEVWICGGQSNMEWSALNLGLNMDSIKVLLDDRIHVFDVPNKVAFTPQQDIGESNWYPSDLEEVANFSIVGYLFGKKLAEELDVPIGLIGSNWGGTEVETWISPEVIKSVKVFDEELSKINGQDLNDIQKIKQQKLDSILATFGTDQVELINGIATWEAYELNEKNWKDALIPGVWEKTAGWENINGVVWYRHHFILPDGIIGQAGTLHLGQIDDSDITWINGQKVGSRTNAHNKDRIYQVPAGILKAGENTIAVRVEDYGGEGGFKSPSDALSLSIGKDTYPLSGKWKVRISPKHINSNSTSISPNDYPSLLYNGMIEGLIPYAIQGAIWYQGESNAERAYQYRKLFPMLIENWRTKWGREFPFFWVQLANFKTAPTEPSESTWAELREAQTMTLKLNNTGQALAIDLGEADDIHPKNKQDVASRLAFHALAKVYGFDIFCEAPLFDQMTIQGNKAIIQFKHTEGGLYADDRYGYLKGFTIAGKNKIFKWAQAQIKGSTIIVSHPDIDKPVAVRYAWADNPQDANLYNGSRLPACPFRTDDFKGITYGNE